MAYGLTITNSAGKVVIDDQFKTYVLGRKFTLPKTISDANTSVVGYQSGGVAGRYVIYLQSAIKDKSDPLGWKFELGWLGQNLHGTGYAYPIVRVLDDVMSQDPDNAVSTDHPWLFRIPVGGKIGITHSGSLGWVREQTAKYTNRVYLLQPNWHGLEVAEVVPCPQVAPDYGVIVKNTAGEITYNSDAALGVFKGVTTFSLPLVTTSNTTTVRNVYSTVDTPAGEWIHLTIPTSYRQKLAGTNQIYRYQLPVIERVSLTQLRIHYGVLYAGTESNPSPPLRLTGACYVGAY